MDLEHQFAVFPKWFFGDPGSSNYWAWATQEGDTFWQSAAIRWLLTVFVILAAALIVSLLVSIIRRGPVKGTKAVFRAFCGGFGDLLHFSPRRVGAIASMVFKEAMRRRVWIVFIIFAVILMLRALISDPSVKEPGKVNLSWVLDISTFLVILLSLFLSCFGIPNDLVNRTIYTVVTKPVRSNEIILGRILGIVLVGTVILAVMGPASYVFVLRQVNHTHKVHDADLKDAQHPTRGDRILRSGSTAVSADHRHELPQRD